MKISLKKNQMILETSEKRPQGIQGDNRKHDIFYSKKN